MCSLSVRAWARLGAADTTTLQLSYDRGIRNHVRDANVLDKTEFTRVNRVVNDHNTNLEDLATLYKMPIALVGKRTLDFNAAFPNFVGKSFLVNDVIYSGEPVRGNFYSLNYVSLNPRGNALLANAFILAINSLYRANIPAIEATKLPTAVLQELLLTFSSLSDPGCGLLRRKQPQPGLLREGYHTRPA